MHAIGFQHTIRRPDIEKCVTINWENLKPDCVDQFLPWKYGLQDQGPCDYLSVMMHNRYAVINFNTCYFLFIQTIYNTKLMFVVYTCAS